MAIATGFEIIVYGTPIAQPKAHSCAFRGKDDKYHARTHQPTSHPVYKYRGDIREQAQRAMAEKGQTVHDGPVSMDVKWVFPRPKRLVWKKRPMPRQWHTTKPDTDNLMKGIKDTLIGVAYLDDSQVCSEVIQKYIASGDEQPRTEIRIRFFYNVFSSILPDLPNPDNHDSSKDEHDPGKAVG